MGRHSAERPEPRVGRSRRAFLTTAGVGTAAAAGGIAIGGNLLQGVVSDAAPSSRSTAAPILPVAPSSQADVLALARANVGRRWRSSEWEAYFGSAVGESAAWLSWLLRGVGMPRTTAHTRLKTWLEAHGTVDLQPKPGAIVFYMEGRSSSPYRAGFVESVTAGVAQTIEGGKPDNIDPRERFVRRFSAPWSSPVVFGHPPYGHPAST